MTVKSAPRVSASALRPRMARRTKIRSPATIPNDAATPFLIFNVAERTTTSATLELGIAARPIMIKNKASASHGDMVILSLCYRSYHTGEISRSPIIFMPPTNRFQAPLPMSLRKPVCRPLKPARMSLAPLARRTWPFADPGRPHHAGTPMTVKRRLVATHHS